MEGYGSRVVRMATYMTVGIYKANYTTYSELMDAIKFSAEEYGELVEEFNEAEE